MLWLYVALVLAPAGPDTEGLGNKGRAEAGGRDQFELAPDLADFVVEDNGRAGVDDPVAVSDIVAMHRDLIHNAGVAEDAGMVDPVDVPPIVAAEDKDEAQEDIGLVYPRLVVVDMSSCDLLAEEVNAVAHILGDSPAAGGMQDVKGLPSEP